MTVTLFEEPLNCPLDKISPDDVCLEPRRNLSLGSLSVGDKLQAVEDIGTTTSHIPSICVNGFGMPVAPSLKLKADLASAATVGNSDVINADLTRNQAKPSGLEADWECHQQASMDSRISLNRALGTNSSAYEKPLAVTNGCLPHSPFEHRGYCLREEGLINSEKKGEITTRYLYNDGSDQHNIW